MKIILLYLLANEQLQGKMYRDRTLRKLLLSRGSLYPAVLWNPESLGSHVSQFPHSALFGLPPTPDVLSFLMS